MCRHSVTVGTPGGSGDTRWQWIHPVAGRVYDVELEKV